jgi:hypothetical protein
MQLYCFIKGHTASAVVTFFQQSFKASTSFSGVVEELLLPGNFNDQE